MTDHPYDNPDLSPLAFLQAVYSDPSVNMYHRMRAAEVAAPYMQSRPVFQEREAWPGEHLITIVIGGLGSNSVSVEQHEAKVQGSCHPIALLIQPAKNVALLHNQTMVTGPGAGVWQNTVKSRLGSTNRSPNAETPNPH